VKRAFVLSIVLVTLLIVSPGDAQESAKRRYASVETAETATIVDSKGVIIHAEGFGKLFGARYLTAYLGDSEVEVPFDRIDGFVAGKITDHRLEMEILLTSGRRLHVLLDRPEYETLYGGTADFGYFRLRLQDIRSLTWNRTPKQGEGLGQRCSRGHMFYNDSWHYCPYDGLKLTPIKLEAEEGSEPR
jgi:hypothetical protein